MQIAADLLGEHLARDGALEPAHLAHGVAAHEAAEGLRVVLLVAVDGEPLVEAGRDVVGALEATRRLPLQAEVDQVDQLAVDLGPQLAQIRRGLAGGDLHHLEVVLGDPGAAAGEELEEHHAQREQVGAAVDLVGPGLLRRHVGGLALVHPGERLGEALLGLGRAEVGDLHLPVEADQHVAGGEIAVDEVLHLPVRRAQRVGGAQAPADAEGDVDDHALAERLAGVEDGLHQPEQGHALDQLDGEVRALLVAPPPRHLDHVGVPQPVGDPDLVEELTDEGGVLGDVGVEPLHRHQRAGARRRGEEPAEVDAGGRPRRDLGERVERDRAGRGRSREGRSLRRERGERHPGRLYQTSARAAAIACETPPRSALKCRSR